MRVMILCVAIFGIFGIVGVLSVNEARAEVLSVYCGAAPLKSCASVLADYSPKVTQMVEGHLSVMYSGKVADLLSPSGVSPDAVPTPSCNLSAGERNRNLSPGQACGAPCTFTCRVYPSPSPSPSPNPSPFPSPTMTCSPSPAPATSGMCERERAYTRGEFIDLVNQKRIEVLQEMSASPNVLNVGPKCTVALGGGTGSLIAQFDRAVSQWRTYVSSLAGAPLPTCRSNVQEKAIAHCQLTGAETAMHAFVFQVAVCEVFARAEDDWLSRASLLPPPALYRTALRSAAACFPAPGVYPSTADLSACVNGDYATRMPNEFRRSPPFIAGTQTIDITPGIWNLCRPSSGGGWEPLICGGNPPSPWVTGILGTLTRADEYLRQVQAGVTAAQSGFGDAPALTSP